MRVLHLDSGAEWRGGQQQIYWLVESLASLGVEQQAVVRAGGPLARRLAALDIPARELACKSEISASTVCRLAAIVRQFQPDIVHAHDSRTLGLAVQLKLLRPRWKLVGSRRVAFPIKRNLFWRLKYEWGADRMVAVSDYICRQLAQAGIARDRLALIYDGFDDGTSNSKGHDEARRQWNVGADETVIGCAGQLVAEKGHEYLIQGFQKIKAAYPKARLMLAGEGPLRSPLEQLAGRLLPPGSFSFVGFVEPLEDFLSGLDLFVFPSLAEGLGSTLLLAMSRQIPVCASRTGGIPELIVDGQTGSLFEPADSAALARIVIQLLEDPAIAKRQAEEARRRVSNQFSIGRMASQTHQLYVRLLEGVPAR